jgi:mRNA-degrading endonuclease RelE of RelBE toxin-antitoxin system
MRGFDIQPRLAKKLVILSKKNIKLHEAVMKKIEEIVDSSNINYYKNLRYDFKSSKRVHIGHFVLVFSYKKHEDIVVFEEFDHHDRVYLG